VQLWAGLLQEEARGAPAPPRRARGGGAPRPQAAPELGLDLPRLEGTLFVLLCSYDGALRRDAYDALGALRALHQKLEERRAEPPGARRREPPGARPVGRGSGGGSGGGGSGGGCGEAELRGSGGSELAAHGGGPRHAPSASRDSIDFVRALGERAGLLGLGSRLKSKHWPSMVHGCLGLGSPSCTRLPQPLPPQAHWSWSRRCPPPSPMSWTCWRRCGVDARILGTPPASLPPA
jgi:hypothetical protein